MRDEQLEKIISEIVTPCAWSTPADLQMAYIAARDVALAYKTKLEYQEPVAWRVWLKDLQTWSYSSIYHGCGEPLYTPPISIEHIPDVGKMVSQSQKPVAWRITAKRFCGDFTKDSDIAQYWLEKEPESIKPLYLAPTLPLEPSDELIAEIKAMADIRLVDGRVELSNVKEIIHAIVHHPIYAN